MSMTVTHAGAKDHPVTLQKKTPSRGDTGGVEYSWADTHQLMASRSDKSGGEDYEASQKTAMSRVSWRIWYRDGINAGDWRLRDDYSGDIYDIENINQIGRRQELELMTEIKDNE